MASLELIVGVVVLVVLCFVSIVAVYAARYKRVPPGRAMVVYGARYRGGAPFQVVTSGGRFIQPILESYAVLSVEPFRVEFVLDRVSVNVRGATPGVAEVSVGATAKIPANTDAISKAASHFLQASKDMFVQKSEEATVVRRSEDEMKRVVSAILESRVREALTGDVQTSGPEVARVVSDATRTEFSDLGLELVTLSVSLRMKGSTRAGDAHPLEAIAQELERLDARLRRVEERLGAPASGG